MTKVAVWCRHRGDNIIGIGPRIPWHVSSDFKRFRRLTAGQNVVAGQTTYETFPNRTLPDRRIYVLTLDSDYEVADSANHFVVNDVNFFKNFAEDIYISGGASVYRLFMTTDLLLLPDIVVDCEYQPDLPVGLVGTPVDISSCIEVLHRRYRQVSPDYEQDGIVTRVYVKTGDFVEQSVLKHVFTAIEKE